MIRYSPNQTPGATSRTLLDLATYLAWAGLALAATLCAVFCVCWRQRLGAVRRKQLAAATFSRGRESDDDQLAEAWPSSGEQRSRRGSLQDALVKGEHMSAREQAAALPCQRRPCCCLTMAALNAVWAVSASGMLVFIAFALDTTDLSGGNPDFDTLALGAAGSTSVSVNWAFHSGGDAPETLLYEVALAAVVGAGAAGVGVAKAADAAWAVVFFGQGEAFQFAALEPEKEYAFRLRFYVNNIPTLWSTARVFATAPPAAGGGVVLMRPCVLHS